MAISRLKCSALVEQVAQPHHAIRIINPVYPKSHEVTTAVIIYAGASIHQPYAVVRTLVFTDRDSSVMSNTP
jgi:hypothetical protein